MQRDAQPINSNQPIDPQAVADIAGKVLARLASMAEGDATSVADQVVSVDTLQRLPEGSKRLSIRPDAVVTPAARDEARHRGITIKPTNDDEANRLQAGGDASITDTDQPARAAAAVRQLSLRGIDLGSARVVLSDTPAREVWQQCSTHAERAGMVSAAGDVARLADELDPTVWVLDMKRLNLIAAVNAIAAITRSGSQTK